jgi:GNAT superfamily N-acetyltransferase
MNVLDRLSERPASFDDEDFLFQVYASTRAEEVAAWGWQPRERENFLRVQYRARRQFYREAYSGAVQSILHLGGALAGTVLVWRTRSEIRLVDIALLPECRNRGLGTQWILGLIEEARTAALPLRLSVLRENPAVRLYERLGFSRKAGDAMYIEMEHHGVTTEQQDLHGAPA